MPKKPEPDGISAPTQREKRLAYIEDYISGVEVKATPEEIGAVQIYARRLVGDYDYDKANWSLLNLACRLRHNL